MHASPQPNGSSRHVRRYVRRILPGALSALVLMSGIAFSTVAAAVPPGTTPPQVLDLRSTGEVEARIPSSGSTIDLSALPVAPVTGTIDEDNYSVDYTLTLEAGDKLLVWFDKPEAAAISIDLYALPSYDGIGGWSWWYPEKPLAATVPADGEYVLTVAAMEGFQGSASYSFEWQITSGESNDNPPGDSISPSPVSGSFDLLSDPDDHYSFYAWAGEVIEISLTGTVGTDFDLHVYGPPNEYGREPHLESSHYGGSEEHVIVRAAESGTHYVVVNQSRGTGEYQLAWSVDYDGIQVTRIAGADRIGTAIEASQLAFPSGSASAVLATAYDWPDALGGSGLAGALDCPILLTRQGELPPEVDEELRRLGASTVYVLGGAGAVSSTAMAQVDAIPGVSVERIGGLNRYETARLIAERTIEEINGWDYGWYDGVAFVATGANYPDALAASPLAYDRFVPIYLVNPSAGDNAQTAYAMSGAGVTSAIVLGGTGAVPAPVETRLRSVLGNATRIAGADRVATSLNLADYAMNNPDSLWYPRWNHVAVATGWDYPDALAGGPVQGKSGSFLLLTHGTYLDPSVRTALSDNRWEIAEVRILGGTGPVTPAVESAIHSAIR